MTDDVSRAAGRWEQLNRCPDCGADMQRSAQVGEQMGLYYRCDTHGRFRYSWDNDTLERVPEMHRRQLHNATMPNSQVTPKAGTPKTPK